MSATDYATWAGTILSVIAMAVSIHKANHARKDADKAEIIRNEISARAKQGELSNLNGLLASALRTMDKYGPGTTELSRRGCSPESDASAVRAVTTEMTRLQTHLSQKLGAEIECTISKINDLLRDFATPQPANKRAALGETILLEILALSGNMKKELDENTFG